MINLDALTIDRGEMSDLELYHTLDKMNIEGGNPMTRTTRRIIKSGNISVTLEYFELHDEWSFIND